MRVPAAGGTPQLLLAPDGKSGQRFIYPQLLPDGKSVLFAIVMGTSIDTARVAVLDLKTRTHRVLINSGYQARYAPSGHLVYARGFTLLAAPFDLKRLAVTGPEVPVAESIGQEYSFSDSSLMVFVRGSMSVVGGLSPSKVEWIDRQGNSQPLTETPQRWAAIAIAPNGKLVAGSIWDYESNSPRSDIWLYDLERRTLTRLTSGGVNRSPVWTPDGRWVTYGSQDSAHYQEGAKESIYRVPADKSGPPELLLASDCRRR